MQLNQEGLLAFIPKHRKQAGFAVYKATQPEKDQFQGAVFAPACRNNCAVKRIGLQWQNSVATLPDKLE